MSESTEQAAFVSWFNLQYKKYSVLMWANPSGFFLSGKSARNYGQIAKLKREGWQNGIPDITLAVPNSAYSGLYIEFKDVNKKESALTTDQKEKLDALSSVGYLAVMCAGFDKAKEVVNNYMETAAKI